MARFDKALENGLMRASLAGLRLLAALPYPLAMKAGNGLGYLIGVFGPTRRRIVQRNLELAFPETKLDKRRRMAWDNLACTGRMLVETTLGFCASDKQLIELADIEGIEHLHAAQQKGKGVLLLTLHMTCLDIAIALLNARLVTDGKRPMRVMMREHGNAVMGKYFRDGRSRHGGTLIDKNSVRELYRALADGEAVWYGTDQDFNYNHVFVDFFGVQTAWLKSISKLVARTGCEVVPYSYYHKPSGPGAPYQLRLGPALKDFPGGDEQADAQRIASLIEARIREHPEQYLWAHRRFKTRPEGTPDRYA